MKHLLTALFLLFTATLFAQDWEFPQHPIKAIVQQFKSEPLISGNEVVMYAMQFISGAADGANQAIVYHGIGKGSHFWDYNTSWKNKYRDYDGGDHSAAFPGSKTWLVMFTDGNHLTRGISRGFSICSLAIAMRKSNNWTQVIKKAIISSLINRLGFTLVYDHVLKQ